MVYCVAYNYNLRSGHGLGMYTFPKAEYRRKIWVQKVTRQNFVPSEHSRLCSRHFDFYQFLIDPHQNREDWSATASQRYLIIESQTKRKVQWRVLAKGRNRHQGLWKKGRDWRSFHIFSLLTNENRKRTNEHAIIDQIDKVQNMEGTYVSMLRWSIHVSASMLRWSIHVTYSDFWLLFTFQTSAIIFINFIHVQYLLSNFIDCLEIFLLCIF